MNTEYENLINSLIEAGYLKTPAIIEAFKKIDRLDFIPEEQKSEAYVNAPLSIGFGQTISQPLTVAFMIELIEPKIGEKILEIGSGSGWQTALLCELVKEETGTGKIIALEIIKELKETTEKNIAKYDSGENKIAEIILTDGSKGYKKEAPYDKIIAAAASVEDVPLFWKRQLKIGGRIVAPVDDKIVVIDKIGKAKYERKEYFGFSFVPLVNNS